MALEHDWSRRETLGARFRHCKSRQPGNRATGSRHRTEGPEACPSGPADMNSDDAQRRPAAAASSPDPHCSGGRLRSAVAMPSARRRDHGIRTCTAAMPATIGLRTQFFRDGGDRPKSRPSVTCRSASCRRQIAGLASGPCRPHRRIRRLCRVPARSLPAAGRCSGLFPCRAPVLRCPVAARRLPRRRSLGRRAPNVRCPCREVALRAPRSHGRAA